jgi:hypothetical protein
MIWVQAFIYFCSACLCALLCSAIPSPTLALIFYFYDILQKHSCIRLLNTVRMLISHFQFILTSESTQYMSDAVPILKSSWRKLPACLRQLFSLLAKAFMRNNFSMFLILKESCSVIVFTGSLVYMWRATT